MEKHEVGKLGKEERATRLLYTIEENHVLDLQEAARREVAMLKREELALQLLVQNMLWVWDWIGILYWAVPTGR